MRNRMFAWTYGLLPRLFISSKEDKNPSNYTVEKLDNTLTQNENNLFFNEISKIS